MAKDANGNDIPDDDTGADQTGKNSDDSGKGNPPADDYPEGMGDAGKRALDTMKGERNEAKRQLAELRTEFDSFKAQHAGNNDPNRNGGNDDKSKEDDVSDDKGNETPTVDPDAIRKSVEDSIRAAANKRYLRSEVRRLSVDKLQDAGDSLHYLDLSDLTPDEFGEFSESSITGKLDQLIKDRPYLAKTRFQGGADAGQRGDSPQGQLTAADLKSMTPQQINEARAQGRLKDVLAGK